VLWLVFIWGLQVSVALRMPLASTLVCAYALGIARELARGARAEERARRIACWLCLLHAGFFAARAVLGPTFGLTAHNPQTALSIWAAIIAFETILYAVGLSILIVAALRDKEALADRRRALTDALTGIGNRHAFEMQARLLVERPEIGEPRPMLLLMDIDRFKAVNDRQGHAAGDRVLAAVAAAARACLIDKNLFWRIGGDEFVALLRGPAVVRAPLIVEAIRCAVKQAQLADHDDPAVAVTIGLASAHAGQSLAEVLAEADAALYAGKRRGRDCAVIAGMPSVEIGTLGDEGVSRDRPIVVNG
jgi:diguanylate cyclase (GGDEF)-like protein